VTTTTLSCGCTPTHETDPRPARRPRPTPSPRHDDVTEPRGGHQPPLYPPPWPGCCLRQLHHPGYLPSWLPQSGTGHVHNLSPPSLQTASTPRRTPGHRRPQPPPNPSPCSVTPPTFHRRRPLPAISVRRLWPATAVGRTGRRLPRPKPAPTRRLLTLLQPRRTASSTRATPTATNTKKKTRRHRLAHLSKTILHQQPPLSRPLPPTLRRPRPPNPSPLAYSPPPPLLPTPPPKQDLRHPICLHATIPRAAPSTTRTSPTAAPAGITHPPTPHHRHPPNPSPGLNVTEAAS